MSRAIAVRQIGSADQAREFARELRQLAWLVQVGLLTEDHSSRLRVASIQAENAYKKQLEELRREIEQHGPANRHRAGQ